MMVEQDTLAWLRDARSLYTTYRWHLVHILTGSSDSVHNLLYQTVL